jgi:signal transduction histidine kinase
LEPILRAPILLVDDTSANLVALEAVLHGRENELVTATSGMEAIAHVETREFAVVLLDLQMPVMDGVETALRIRRLADGQGRTVPVIFLTATDADVSRVLNAYASGAVDFMQKPLQPEILRSKVSIFADLYRARQRLMAEIEERRRLQDALRARNELLAIVSHDLRNPLNAVLLGAGQVERAAEDHAWVHAKSVARKIAHAVDRMSRLVEDLLDLATVDSGRPLSMSLGRHDLAELGVEIAELLEPLARERHLVLTMDLAASTFVHCDRDRVQQVLGNLIGNAIKFTEAGSIDVRASRGESEVVVSVADTGVGIRPDQLPHIFEPYWKAHAARRDGAGLGLSIAKVIVEAHGGRFWVDSTEGKGTTFFFTLRVAVSSPGLPTDVPVRSHGSSPEVRAEG